MKKIELQEQLERRLLKGLECEWISVVSFMPIQYRNLMKKPFFSITDTRSRLGSWHANRREICISRNLILNHSWDDVCEVLRHEMAHQFKDEVLHARNETPHGPAFQDACRIIRADPKASGKYKPLHDRIASNIKNSEDKIMIRIKKLLALAESKNRHEAEAAMAKAQKLIIKHNIDFISNNEKRNFSSIYVGNPKLKRTRDDYYLAHLLQDFYFVRSIWVPSFVLDKDKMGRILEISGTPHNLTIASYTYDYVRNFIDSQWRVYNKDKKLHYYRKADFAVGIIEGFQSKLIKEQKKEADKYGKELVVIDDPLLKEYIDKRYHRLTSRSRRPSNTDKKVLKDGEKIGKKLVISKGITNRSNERNKLIE